MGDDASGLGPRLCVVSPGKGGPRHGRRLAPPSWRGPRRPRGSSARTRPCRTFAWSWPRAIDGPNGKSRRLREIVWKVIRQPAFVAMIRVWQVGNIAHAIVRHAEAGHDEMIGQPIVDDRRWNPEGAADFHAVLLPRHVRHSWRISGVLVVLPSLRRPSGRRIDGVLVLPSQRWRGGEQGQGNDCCAHFSS